MNKRDLEAQADRIEMVLRDHKAPAQVTGGTVTPRWVQFQLRTMPGIKLNKIEALSREIALALGVTDTTISARDGAVRIDVPRVDPQPVKLLALDRRVPRQNVPFGAALLGLADDGAPLLMRVPSPDVSHVLISGTTGSGKTALVQSIVVSLALHHRRSDLQLVLIDPKGSAFAALQPLPHLLCPIVTQPDRAVEVLAEMARLMDLRSSSALEIDRALHIQRRAGAIKPRVIIVIDELADLIQTGGAAIVTHLGRLVQRGREVGVHVIAATQKPSSAVVGPIVKANFPLRLVGRVVSADDARVAAGVGGTHAEQLDGHGDFVAVAGTGVVRFQAAYISEREMAEVAEKLGFKTKALGAGSETI